MFDIIGGLTNKSTRLAITRESIEINRAFYVFGRNICAMSLISNSEVLGVVDAFTTDDNFLGVPVVKTASLSEKDMMSVASGEKTLSDCRQLERRKKLRADYFFFKKNSGRQFQEITFNENFEVVYRNNDQRFQEIRSKLSDCVSKNIFDKHISFRLYLNIEDLDGFSGRQELQYLETFLPQNKEHVFYDVGCFDGATSLLFAEKYPNYKRIFAFEPSEVNLAHSKYKLEELRNTEVFQFGLSDKNEIKKMSLEGSASKIDDKSEYEVQVTKGDDLEIEAPIFIKINVEGFEAEVLEGLKNRIKENIPPIAVSIYHRPNDFIAIPEQVLGIHSDYNIFIRHYTETIYETVMFFVPKTADDADSEE
ncbi:FkbM family methyltransferase [Planktomarina temperata]|nr:FkbM family methyltransferase [Planktomarina temperata]